MAKYLLDANCLIEPYRRFYPMDLAPGFWAWLEQQFVEQNIVLPRIVFQEISPGDDLHNWMQQQAKSHDIVLDPDKPVTDAVGVIGGFVLANYTPEHANDFLNGGDPWLVAHGMADKQLKIITFERYQVPQQNGKTKLYQGKVMLPFAAKTFNVECISLFDVMRITGAQLR